MKRYMFTLGMFFILLILSPTNHNIVFAEEILEHEDYFIDLDGDGFNDNTQDTNNKKGSDDYSDANQSDSQSDDNNSNLVSLDFGQNRNYEEILSNSEKFNLKMFSTRAHSLNRCESGAEMGGNPGNGIGTGFINNVCVGGICF